ncbi:5-(carboxyamino)imidazole ribonucleotide mutase [Candidatus Mesenet endosymbiont of Agriotes lineatus]|uniref:5-(carboxyamino)imidazole ribonucleotide mutase n=1 Tax=Candidatus Mesenet endosymbiont of Agriotes lineatus TaxID=3077948 RepID=UPI0030D15014
MAAEVAIIMGSESDFATMENSLTVFKELQIPYEVRIISAHRTPDRLFDFAKSAEKEGFKVIIAGAGGAAHLPGMTAALTHLPVIGVPIQNQHLNGIDSLFSIIQMPKGVPVATMAIGSSGAFNAAIMAASILSISNINIADKLKKWRDKQTNEVKKMPSSLMS